MHKHYKAQGITLDAIYAKGGTVDRLKKNIIASRASLTQKKLNYLLGKGYYFEDSDGIIFKSLDIFYRRYKITNNLGIGADTGIFSLEEKRIDKKNGIRYGLSFFYDHFSLRLGKNDFDNFSEIVPTIQYQNKYENHNYVLEYTRQNALFYTYRLCSYYNRMKADHFSASDYITFENKTNLWANATLNSYDNNDREIIGQFDWHFYYDTLLNKKLIYNLALEGYYVLNTEPNNCFYSPNFNDSTLLRVDSNYHINKYLNVKGMFGAGYSFQSNQFLYKYGLWLHGDLLKDFSYHIDCMQSNSAKKGIRGKGYYYRECQADLGYRW